MNWISTLKSRIASMVTRASSYWYRDGLHLNIPRHAGKVVTEDEAYTVSAYWCSVRVICESISQMPWRVHERTRRGNRIAETHPADRLLFRSPNPVQDAPAFKELMLRWVLSWGNAYAEIVRDSSARPRSLWPVEPWRVRPYIDGGQVIYEVRQPDGSLVYVPAADMLHFRGMGSELMGWSVINAMARTLGLSAAQEDSFAAQMENGVRLSGVLVPKDGGTIPDTRIRKLEQQWQAQNAGAKKHGRVALMAEGLDFHQFSMPNSDAQLLESRQFSVIDICRFMRVPPHKVYDLSRATWSNITHQSLEFWQDSLGPHISKLEAQADRKLISSASNQYYTALDATAVLRMDPGTRVRYYNGLSQLGAMSPNDVREGEGLDSLGPKGDIYTIPANVQTLDRASQPPEPSTPPGPGTPPGGLDSDTDGNGASNNGHHRRIRTT